MSLSRFMVTDMRNGDDERQRRQGTGESVLPSNDDDDGTRDRIQPTAVDRIIKDCRGKGKRTLVAPKHHVHILNRETLRKRQTWS